MRRKIHVQIALVGAQPTPVYQGIVHMQPNQVILICSKETEKVAKDIRVQLPSYDNKDVIIYKVSDTDLGQMYSMIEEIESVLPKGITVSLNISGGMKLWSVIFNTIFRRKRRSCQTFFIGQDGTFFDLKEKVTKGKVAFDMDAQFKILGHQLDEYTLYSDYTPADFDVLNRVSQLGFSEQKHFHLFKITELFLEEYKAAYGNILLKHDFETSYSKNKLTWNAAEHSFDCQLGSKTYTFTSEHVEHIVLNTGWFELYVAHFIAKIYDAKDIWMNCVFKNVKNLPKNEIDIIVNTGSKLIFVECKTQIFNTTDVDKFRSAVRNYGGLGSKPLFVTNSLMKPEGLEKCNDHRITTFYLDNPAYANMEEKVKALAKVFDEMNRTWNV